MMGRQKGKVSIREQLSHFKQVIQEMAAGREKNREKGGMER